MVEMNIQYTAEIYRQFCWFSLFRGKYYRCRSAAFPFIIAMILISAVLYYVWFGSFFAVVLAVFAVLIGVLTLTMPLIRSNLYSKQAPILFQTSTTIIFAEDHFSSVQTGGVASGKGTIKYAAIYKVFETRDAFYVYMTPRQALLLPQKSIAKGSPEELRSLLQANLPGRRYVLCK